MRYGFSLLTLILLPTISHAQLDPARFDAFVRKEMRHWTLPGIAVAVTKSDRLLYAKGYGLRDVQRKLPVTPRTLFAIGSTTKAFTAVLLGMLVDEKKLQWDTPVRHYLPEFVLSDRFLSARITPRDLLTHRSGLPRHDLVWYGRRDLTRKALIQRLRYLPKSADLRVKWQYNNLMFTVAGYLAGRVTDSTWETLVTRRVLRPLGMTDVTLSVGHSTHTPDHAQPYGAVDPKTGRRERLPFRNIDLVGPAGSINASVIDMAKWLRFLLAQGKVKGRQLLKPATLKTILAPQMVMPNIFAYLSKRPGMEHRLSCCTYAMGWISISYRGRRLLIHGGGIDGFSAFVGIVPESGVGAVVLTNGGELAGWGAQIVFFRALDRALGLSPLPFDGAYRWLEGQRAKKLRAMKKALVAKLAGAKKQPQKAPLSAYCGRFQHPAYGWLAISNGRNEELLANYRGLFTGVLSHVGKEHWLLRGESIFLRYQPLKLEFVTDQGRVTSVRLTLEPAVKPLLFQRDHPGN